MWAFIALIPMFFALGLFIGLGNGTGIAQHDLCKRLFDNYPQVKIEPCESWKNEILGQLTEKK